MNVCFDFVFEELDVRALLLITKADARLVVSRFVFQFGLV